jgi:predicted PurR-regulated permease PerM
LRRAAGGSYRHVTASRQASSDPGVHDAAPGVPANEAASEAEDERPGDKLTLALAAAERTDGLGRPGRPLDRRSPFFVGMAAAAGVAVTYGVAELIIRARSVLVLIGLALFIAAGLEPVVQWLTERRMPRWAAVLTVIAAVAAVLAGFVLAAIPPLASQATALAQHLPQYLHSLRDPHSEFGRLNIRYHIEQRITEVISSRGGSIASGVLGAGKVVLSAATSAIVLIVLTIYFLAGMPRIKRFLYRFAPQSRRTRVILLGDEIFTKVGGYLLGNVLTSVVAGGGTYVWMVCCGIPYPALLALTVALLDLIPVIGSTLGGAMVTLVALTVSLPVAGLTLAFYVGYRLAEDYLLVPRIMGRTVKVPAAVTVVAVLVGAALLGLIGALVAIPAAASVRLLLQEITFRRMDRT